MAITETRSLPPQFVEDLGKDYAAQLTGLTSQKLNTKDFQPMVAPQDQATQDAYTRSTTQGQGIGAYAPYLAQAGQYQTGTGTFAGLPTNMMGAQDLTGPDAYKQFMSPYQQDVIDATLSEYDSQAAQGLAGIGQQAAMSGNLGGGREGVMRAQYQNKSDMNRALLQSGLLQQGFTQANQLAQQQFGNQMNLAQNVPSLQGQDIASLTTLGGALQAQKQNELSANQQLNIQNLNQPLTAAQQYGSGVTQLIAGYPGKTTQDITPNPSGLQSLISAGSGLAGIYRTLNPVKTT